MEVIKSELMFPKLNRAGDRNARHIRSERSTAGSEVLFDPGDTNVPVFVVLDGCLDIVRVFKKASRLLCRIPASSVAK